MRDLVIIGCGYVADLYMHSLTSLPELRLRGAYDSDPARLAAFCAHWKLRALPDMAATLAACEGALALNLTPASAHAEVTRNLLQAGVHVWSESPLALDFAEARALHDLALARGVHLATAPSSVLGEAAQTFGRAVRGDAAGGAGLVYAELDNGFISQAPLETWVSASGAPWPYADAFSNGVVIEQGAYWLSWLIAFFGPVQRIVAASAQIAPGKRGIAASGPDFAVATLFFANGTVARLTNSVIAPQDYSLRWIGDRGVVKVAGAWDNAAKVTFRRRLVIRRRLMASPLRRRLRLAGTTHPHVGRKGAMTMNFALGPAEMCAAIAAGRVPRLAGDYALHLAEVTLAIRNAGGGGLADMTTTCRPLEPMPWAL